MVPSTTIIFFFQAEDGIRDLTVTGVQTCALPISFVSWFDLEHVSRSPAQFNPEKLAWLNQQYLKAAPDASLAPLVGDALKRRGISAENGQPLARVIALVKESAITISPLADMQTLSSP